MKKKYVCSIFLKVLLLLLELLFVVGVIYEFVRDDVFIACAYILGLLLCIIFDYILLSLVIFKDKNVIVFCKFKIIQLNYCDIKKVHIFENVRAAFLIGSTFDFVFAMKDNKLYKFHIGQILRVGKLKQDIQNILSLKCIKFENKDC